MFQYLTGWPNCLRYSYCVWHSIHKSKFYIDNIPAIAEHNGRLNYFYAGTRDFDNYHIAEHRRLCTDSPEFSLLTALLQLWRSNEAHTYTISVMVQCTYIVHVSRTYLVSFITLKWFPYSSLHRTQMVRFCKLFVNRYCKFGNFREGFIFANLRICEVS